MTIFGGLPLPAPFAVPGGLAWGEAHEVLANLLLAALWHQFILRDRALSRMLRG